MHLRPKYLAPFISTLLFRGVSCTRRTDDVLIPLLRYSSSTPLMYFIYSTQYCDFYNSLLGIYSTLLRLSIRYFSCSILFMLRVLNSCYYLRLLTVYTTTCPSVRIPTIKSVYVLSESYNYVVSRSINFMSVVNEYFMVF